MRDADRQVLAQRAFVLTVMVLEDMLHELTEVSLPTPPAMQTLMEIQPANSVCLEGFRRSKWSGL